jgi:hypothetical protein
MWRTLKPTSEWSESMTNDWVPGSGVVAVWMAVLMVASGFEWRVINVLDNS